MTPIIIGRIDLCRMAFINAASRGPTMNTRIAMIFAGLCLMLTATATLVSAHHSYLLTVQQLEAGLTKAPSSTQKGFVLIDVRSPEEHMKGHIPGTDFNIDFREIQTRHRELGAQFEDQIVFYSQ